MEPESNSVVVTKLYIMLFCELETAQLDVIFMACKATMFKKHLISVKFLISR